MGDSPQYNDVLLLNVSRRCFPNPRLVLLVPAAFGTAVSVNEKLVFLLRFRGLKGEPVIGLSEIFIIFFLMLGPIKIPAPYLRLTAHADDTLRRRLAVRAFAIAVISALVAAFIGQSLLAQWHISISALLITTGLVLFFVAMKAVLLQYAPPSGESPPTPTLAMAVTPLAFPTVITPYGTAALILLMATSHTLSRTMTILAVLFVVLLIDLLAMLYARHLLNPVGSITLQVLGAVLGILQVALAVQIILFALVRLKVLAPLGG